MTLTEGSTTLMSFWSPGLTSQAPISNQTNSTIIVPPLNETNLTNQTIVVPPLNVTTLQNTTSNQTLPEVPSMINPS